MTGPERTAAIRHARDVIATAERLRAEAERRLAELTAQDRPSPKLTPEQEADAAALARTYRGEV